MSEQRTATQIQEEAAPNRAAFSFARKKPFRTVRLAIADDYMHTGGGSGVLPLKTMDRDQGFDPSWSTLMLFHDVFEHWQEFEHRYFQDKYAMNVGGEMYAMGAMTWFVSRLGMQQRLNNNGVGSFYSNEERTVQTTANYIREAIMGDYSRFADRLECAVPKQRRGHHYSDGALENMLLEYEYWYRETLLPEYRKLKARREITESGERYRKSVSMAKIRRLHRYGYYHAARSFPSTDHNHQVMQDWWQQWDKFIRLRPFDDEILPYFSELRFQFYYLDRDRNFTWRARFIPNQDYFLQSKNDPEFEAPTPPVLWGPRTVLE